MSGTRNSQTVSAPTGAGPENRRLLALDPGLDATGWALFQVPPAYVPTLDEYRPYLVGSGYAETAPEPKWSKVPDHVSIPRRVSMLVGHLEAAAPLAPGDLVVLETPAIFGPYRSRAQNKQQRQEKALGMARSMAALWYVIGRLEGFYQASAATVASVPASGDKVEHHRTVLRLWPHLPATKTGPSEDQRDAVSQGLRFLIHHRPQLQGGPYGRQ